MGTVFLQNISTVEGEIDEHQSINISRGATQKHGFLQQWGIAQLIATMRDEISLDRSLNQALHWFVTTYQRYWCFSPLVDSPMESFFLQHFMGTVNDGKCWTKPAAL